MGYKSSLLYKYDKSYIGRGLAKITFSSLCALFPCTLEMRKGSMSHGRGRILYGMLRETYKDKKPMK